MADKKDYAVTAVLNKKFPVAYPDKGRVTAVDMLWADSNIENQIEEVHVPEEIEDFVDAALKNINDKRSEELNDITREHRQNGVGRAETNYRVETKAVNKPEEDPMNFAEIEVVADESGSYKWDDVIEEIDQAENKVENPDDDYWIGVSMDVNNTAAADAIRAIQSRGFEPAGFNPGKLEAEEENRDSLELQYIPSDNRYVKQFIHEAAEFMDRAGMSYEKADVTTENENSQALKV